VAGRNGDNRNYPAHSSKAEIQRIGTLSKLASEHTLYSYRKTTSEIAAHLKTLERLERSGVRIPARDRVRLYYLRDLYLQSVIETYRLGREVIREYLKHSLGEEGE
jgi:hypothetical protein